MEDEDCIYLLDKEFETSLSFRGFIAFSNTVLVLLSSKFKSF